MSHEATLWILRFLPMVVVVSAGLVLYARVKRRGPQLYPPGRGLRLFDKDGNEIRGPLRIVTGVVLVIALIAAVAAVIFPFTVP